MQIVYARIHENGMRATREAVSRRRRRMLAGVSSHDHQACRERRDTGARCAHHVGLCRHCIVLVSHSGAPSARCRVACAALAALRILRHYRPRRYVSFQFSSEPTSTLVALRLGVVPMTVSHTPIVCRAQMGQLFAITCLKFPLSCS
jgi:hypothetical protein